MSARIELINQNNLGQQGKEFIANAVSMRVTGMDIAPVSDRALSFDADDPNLPAQSVSAATIVDTMNTVYGDGQTSRVEFMRVANADGFEDQIVSVKLKVLITHVEDVGDMPLALAVALSTDRTANLSVESVGALFQPNHRLIGVNHDQMRADGVDFFTEFEPPADMDPADRQAYDAVIQNLNKRAAEHATFTYVLDDGDTIGRGIDRPGGLLSKAHREVPFAITGTANCGGCTSAQITAKVVQKAANETLPKTIRTAVQAIVPKPGSFIIQKAPGLRI